MIALNKTTGLLQDVKDSIWNPKDLNFWLSRVHPLWSLTESLAQVVEKKQVATDTVCLTLKCNRHVKLGHAGQHHPIAVLIDGRRYERQYSLAAHPTLKQHLQLTVKKMPAGKVSRYLNDDITLGSILAIGEPYGEMQCTKQPMVLLAAGSGITPMLSLLREWQNQPEQAPVELHYWVKHSDDAAHLTELEQMAVEQTAFTFHLYTTQQQPQTPRLNVAATPSFQLNLQDAVVYACGPFGFVQEAEKIAQSAKQFLGEAFSAPQVSRFSHERHMIQVTLTKQNKTVEIPNDQPILIGLEEAGIQPTFGCRMGVCNKCSCPKAEGHIENMINGEVNREPRTQIKLCINTAQSDLVLDL